jgi:hypothetical protein
LALGESVQSCYRDDSDRLELGGADAKVWRSAPRFSVEALPPEALVITAELSLRVRRDLRRAWTTVSGLRRAPV